MTYKHVWPVVASPIPIVVVQGSYPAHRDCGPAPRLDGSILILRHWFDLWETLSGGLPDWLLVRSKKTKQGLALDDQGLLQFKLAGAMPTLENGQW